MLTAYRVIYNDGTTSVTNMAAGVTLQDARDYFVGKTFEITETTFRTAIGVEQIPYSPWRLGNEKGDEKGYAPLCSAVPCPTVKDDELMLSMFVFMEQHGGERMLRATADACRMIAKRSEEELDGTSRDVWNEAAKKVDEAWTYLEEH